jgi:hypothetical protein
MDAISEAVDSWSVEVLNTSFEVFELALVCTVVHNSQDNFIFKAFHL